MLMSTPSLSACKPSRPGRSSQRLLTSAAAAALVVSAAAAHAAPAASLAFSSGGFASDGAAAVFVPPAAPARRSILQIVPVHLRAGAPAGAPGRLLSLKPQPKDATTGYFLAGAISATWSGGAGVADIKVAEVENQNTSGTSGDLTLSLWTTATLPSVAAGISGYELASADLGSLPAGDEFSNVDTGEISFEEPPAGCYYVSIVLSQGDSVLDLRTFSSSGTPENNGYNVTPFPNAQSCPAATSCTRTSAGACLDSSRFQVTANYANDTTGAGPASVLSFDGTRAESDESVFYYFTDSSNFEVGVKVLDACSFSSSFWVFIGGLTNQGWSINVLDTQTGNTKHYGNADGTTTVTVTDTAALPCP
jgi:hypothetical protein